MKRCCLVGGGGFIGTRLARTLSATRSLLVVDSDPRAGTRLPAEVELLVGDYQDPAVLAQALEGMDEVILLAYATVPKTSYDNPVQDILANLPPVVTLFDLAADKGVGRVVLLSSGGTVYGPSTQARIREDQATNPISPYGITKLSLEKYALMYHRLKGLPVVIVRPANAYGVGQRPFSGQGFIATAIGSLLLDREVVIFGPEGTIRDYVHVEDVARGVAAALEFGEDGGIYNIGTGIGRSNLEIMNFLDDLAREEGLRPRISHLPERRFDVPWNVLDSSLLSSASGWSPRVSLERGLREMWTWLKDELRTGRTSP